MPAEELIAQVVEAGMYAPTGRGMQSPRMAVVTDRAVRDRLAALNAAVMGSASDPFYGAPAVVVVLADRTRPTYLYDGTLVMGNLLNAAHALGLGACWIHRAREVFDSPEGDYEGIGHCVLGYPLPGAVAQQRPRKTDYAVWVG